MKLIEINRRYYLVPEVWNELSKKQLLQVMQLFYSNRYDEDQAKLKLLKILTGMSWWQFFRAPVATFERSVFSFSDLNLSVGTSLFKLKKICYGFEEYMYLVDFMLKDNQLTKNLIPEYKGYYGPADNFDNLIMSEFVFTEHYFMQWVENRNDDKLLNNLVAILYRVKKTKYNLYRNEDGDPRIAFNENLCEYFATTEVHAWPRNVKLAIAYYYDACRQKLVYDNDEIFGGTGEPAKNGLISIMYAVAETNAFGPWKEVEQVHVKLVMMMLKEQIHKANEMERRLKA